ncbi:LuxR C-terminal-related transcriptional regulator [Streptomyces sp. SCSIO 30461]|uniref:LuxR C-terminal-related transcriptional regulator n=1 Tax=Streptomyces sp. SCSIO 30461 TaxID=3118085 RepID=UPI0030D34CCB
MAEDSQPDPGGDPLLASKFAVPAVPPGFVARKRLTDRLTEGARGPLTVISGPAGAGKTTLAASWQGAQGPPGPVVWLTVESEENAPGVFWAYVLGAFRYHKVPLPDIGTPSSADTVDRSLIVRLASALTELPRPVVLVLDGVERVGDRQLAADLEFVLAHAGSALRLVLVGRVDPALPLHRYRAEGRICEIRRSELAFTARETAQLLRQHGLTPSPESVGVLTERTEGWAAGLRLCALAMQRTDDVEHFAQSFAASHNAVADYLMAEVLEAQPVPVQDLLTRTSILAHIHPALADALTGRADGASVLDGLARANAFMEPIGDTSWYRGHPLFAEVLRAHLLSRAPELAPELHLRAAQWFAAADRLHDALEHAAAAGEWGYAAALVVDGLEIGRLLSGPDSHCLERLFEAMPAEVPGAAPALVASATALLRHDVEESLRQLVRAEDALTTGAGPEERETSPERRLTQALLRLLSGGGGSAGGSGCAAPDADGDGEVRALMALVPEIRLSQHPEVEALCRYGRAQALLAAGDRTGAREAFTAALKGADDERTRTVRYHCLGALALTEGVDGMLREAEAHAREGLRTADESGVPDGHRTGLCHLALAAVASERGDLLAAQHHIDAAAHFRSPAHDPLGAAEAAVLRARLALAQGRTAQALDALDVPSLSTARDGAGRDGASRTELPPLCPEAARRVTMARCTVHLARGDPSSALAALDGAADGDRALASAAAHLATGDTAHARRLLAPLGNGASPGPSDRVRARLLQAHAALRDDATAHALVFLGQALDAARPQLLRAPFTESGPWLRHLLARTPELLVDHPWLNERPDDAGDRPLLVEQLSAREREVLRHVAQMMSTQEIAAELYLSVNTVKTHLKSIYRKLSVSRRSDAVRRAREADLL